MSGTAVDDNDPRFTYKSTWVAGGLSEEFNGTHHATDTPGAQVVFGPFSGTSISVFGTIGANQPTVHYFVDSDQQNQDTKVPSELTPQFRQLLYEASNLDATTPHTLQINQLDQGSFTFDFVEIGSPSPTSAPLPTVSPAPTTTISSPSTNPAPAVPVTTLVVPTQTSRDPDVTITLIGTSTSMSTLPTPISLAESGSVVPNQPEPSASSHPSPFTSNRTFIAVICSVVGGFVLILSIAAALVLYARRQHLLQRTRRKPATSSTLDQFPSLYQGRPSLRLRIPDIPVPSRGPGTSSSLLPMYTNSVTDASVDLSSTTKQGPQDDPENSPQEDSNSGPIFDIKQRPVSGTTMTTRVTVGTNIGSIPDEPLPERVPAVPDFPPELTLRHLSWTPSSGSNRNTWTNYSFNINATGTNSTGISAVNSNSSWTTTRQNSTIPPLPRLPTSPKPVVHDDAGVRLDCNLPSPSPLMVELPPPYQNYF